MGMKCHTFLKGFSVHAPAEPSRAGWRTCRSVQAASGGWRVLELWAVCGGTGLIAVVGVRGDEASSRPGRSRETADALWL